MKRAFLVALVALAVGSALARDEDDPAEEKARAIGALVVEKPDVPARLFAKAFLAAVPTSKMAELLGNMFEEGGKVVSVKRVSGDRLQGKFLLEQERGTRTECTLGVAEKEPHKITSLWLKPVGRAARSLGELEKELAKLPGRVSFAVARLGSRSPALLSSVNADDALAIGSSFKLYVLGRLVEDVAQGKRRWTDVTPLRSASRSLPSGMLHAWPAEAPVTLHTLASLMISISDNTATDNLIALLGRERIEQHLDAMGNRTPARSTPFLATNEMFRLKWGKEGAAKRYLASDLAGKRATLETLAREPLPEVTSIKPGPLLISELEWFASANDLVRALDWIRGATAHDETARGVLAINNGGMDATPWQWVGFKGGSEPGVLELAWLLERKDGAWFAVCAGWNDPDSEVELPKLFSIAQGAIGLLAAGSEPRLR